MSRLFALTLRKRIFGGFAAILVLLALLAVVMQRSAGSASLGAERVRSGSDAAEVATAIALSVDDAQVRTAQYALSGNEVDQKAAQDSLARLDGAIAESHDATLAAPMAEYRASRGRGAPSRGGRMADGRHRSAHHRRGDRPVAGARAGCRHDPRRHASGGRLPDQRCGGGAFSRLAQPGRCQHRRLGLAELPHQSRRHDRGLRR